MSENTAIPSESTATPETPAQPEAQTAPEEVPSHIVEDTPEIVGEDIDQVTTYLEGKYNSVGELENGYKELQKSYSQKLGAFDGAPEAGYELGDGSYGNDQGLVDMLTTWGIDNQLSQDGLQSLVGQYQEVAQLQKSATLDAEFSKLGDNAAVRLSNATDFLRSNLGDDATNSLANSMTTAASIEAVEKLIAMSNGPAPVSNTMAQPNVSVDKIKEMRFATNDAGERRMSVEPGYRAKVMKLEAQLQ